MNIIIDFLLVLFGFKKNVPDRPQVDNTQVDQIDDKPDILFGELIRLHNQARKSKGLPELFYDENLCKSSQEHAEMMARKNRMYHGSLNFPGFSYRGENVAMGSQTQKSVFDMWYNSSGHRANILNSNYTHVGFGMQVSTRGIKYWCTQFGRKI